MTEDKLKQHHKRFYKMNIIQKVSIKLKILALFEEKKEEADFFQEVYDKAHEFIEKKMKEFDKQVNEYD